MEERQREREQPTHSACGFRKREAEAKRSTCQFSAPLKSIASQSPGLPMRSCVPRPEGGDEDAGLVAPSQTAVTGSSRCKISPGQETQRVGVLANLWVLEPWRQLLSYSTSPDQFLARGLMIPHCCCSQLRGHREGMKKGDHRRWVVGMWQIGRAVIYLRGDMYAWNLAGCKLEDQIKMTLICEGGLQRVGVPIVCSTLELPPPIGDDSSCWTFNKGREKGTTFLHWGRYQLDCHVCSD